MKAGGNKSVMDLIVDVGDAFKGASMAARNSNSSSEERLKRAKARVNEILKDPRAAAAIIELLGALQEHEQELDDEAHDYALQVSRE